MQSFIPSLATRVVLTFNRAAAELIVAHATRPDPFQSFLNSALFQPGRWSSTPLQVQSPTPTQTGDVTMTATLSSELFDHLIFYEGSTSEALAALLHKNPNSFPLDWKKNGARLDIQTVISAREPR
jgi:hypothetical protein